MDYIENADGEFNAASMTAGDTSMTIAVAGDALALALKDRDAVIQITLRPDDVEELGNVLAEFIAVLDARAGRS